MSPHAVQGSRKLGFRQFLAALEQLAQEKGVPAGALRRPPWTRLHPACMGPAMQVARQLLAGSRLKKLTRQCLHHPHPFVAEELCAQVAGCVGPRLNGTSSGIEPQLLTSRRRSSPHATHSRPPLAAVQAAGSAAAQGRGKSSGCGPAPHEEAAAAVAAAVYKL
jgi:hypothetical protein